MKNAELLKKWIAAIGQDFQPSTASRVCCLHFETSDFIDTPGIRRKILKSNIFPTRNLTYSEGIQNNPLSDLHEAIEIREYIVNTVIKLFINYISYYLHYLLIYNLLLYIVNIL